MSRIKQKEYTNRQLNIFYLAKSINKEVETPSSYVPKESFPSLSISKTYFKNACGRGEFTITEEKQLEVIKKIIDCFSEYLTEDIFGKLTIESLELDCHDFISMFPTSKIKKIPTKRYIRSEFYINKVFRIYYLAPNTIEKAYFGYLKLYKKKNGYCARMLRGLQTDDESIKNWFFLEKEPNVVSDEFKDKIRKNKTDQKKAVEGYHLYEADNSKIRISSGCISIEFKSVETVSCYSTLVWNTEVSNGFKEMETYIGGTALMLDTNEGSRGRQISSYKVGIECVIPLREVMIKNGDLKENEKENDPKETPLNLESPALIHILNLESNNGYLTVDNGDDSRWYRFLLNPKHREKNKIFYSPEYLEEVTKKILELEQNQQETIDKLNQLDKNIQNKLEKIDELIKKIEKI